MTRRDIERKPEQRRQERFPITLQFVFGRDDDLIQWIQSFPEQDRARAVRRLMRSALGFPDSSEMDTRPMQPVIIQEQPDQTDVIQTLLERIARLEDFVERARVQGPIITMQVEDDQPQIDDERAEKRREKLKKARW